MTNDTMARIALIRADGTYQGPGYLTLTASGKLEVEHIDGLGVTRRDGYAISFGDGVDHPIDERLAGAARRAGWRVD